MNYTAKKLASELGVTLPKHPSKVRYAAIADSVSGLTNTTKVHRWMWLETQMDEHYGTAVLRSSTVGGHPAKYLETPSHESLGSKSGHICRVIDKDGWLNFHLRKPLLPNQRLSGSDVCTRETLDTLAQIEICYQKFGLK